VDLGRDTRTSTQSRRLVRRKDASWSLNWPSGANLLARKQHMYFFFFFGIALTAFFWRHRRLAPKAISFHRIKSFKFIEVPPSFRVTRVQNRRRRRSQTFRAPLKHFANRKALAHVCFTRQYPPKVHFSNLREASTA